MKNKKLLIILGSCILITIVFIFIAKSRGWIGGEDAIKIELSDVKSGKIVELVTASGSIQPEVEVNILSLIHI